MTPRRGPTKRLIPAISPETRCPHAYSEDDGLQLEIDCAACQGAQDLDNRKCISGILNVMVMGTAPEAIILKRYIHKRYRGERVRRIADLATSLASIGRAAASIERPSDKRCRTCPVSAERILETVRRKLLEDPESYLDRHAVIIGEVRHIPAGLGCGSASRCIADALSRCEIQPGGV